MVTTKHQDPNKIARLAGLLYLSMVPLGFFGMYGHSNLIVPGDASTTVNNIIASGLTYRLSIMSALVVQIVNIEPIVMYTFWGELLLPLWLLIKGVDVEQWKKLTFESDR